MWPARPQSDPEPTPLRAVDLLLLGYLAIGFGRCGCPRAAPPELLVAAAGPRAVRGPAVSWSPGPAWGRWAAPSERSTPCFSCPGSTASWTFSIRSGLPVHDPAGTPVGAAPVRRAGQPRLVAGRPEPFLVHAASRRLSVLLSDRVGPRPVLRLEGRPRRRCGVSCSSSWQRSSSAICVHLLPGGGTLLRVPPPASWFIDNLPARLAYEALATGSSYGAAFPSSHVAAALAATLAAARAPAGSGLLLRSLRSADDRRGVLPDALRGGRAGGAGGGRAGDVAGGKTERRGESKRKEVSG